MNKMTDIIAVIMASKLPCTVEPEMFNELTPDTIAKLNRMGYRIVCTFVEEDERC